MQLFVTFRVVSWINFFHERKIDTRKTTNKTFLLLAAY